MKILTVVSAFGDYARGAQISDAGKVAELRASDHAAHVVISEVPDPPRPTPPPLKAVE